MRPLSLEQIGGARVMRPFNSSPIAKAKGLDGVRIPLNTELTPAELGLIASANRNALIENRYLMVWPMSGAVISTAGAGVPHANGGAPIPSGETPPEGTKRHIFSRGFGKFDVIEGVIVAEGVTKEEAATVAAQFKPRDPAQPAAPAAARKKKGGRKNRPVAQ